VFVVVSDTHAREDHRLAGRTLEAVREADVVAHAGDFTREPVLEAFGRVAGTFRGVHGNNDDPAVRERLPAARTVEYGGVRFALTHTRRGGETGLSAFGRERDADAVLFGHSHRPTVVTDAAVPLVNPGSHAQPRGNRAAHAEIRPGDGGVVGRLVTPDGGTIERFEIGGR